MNTDRFGFSTGALEYGNYRAALDWMKQNHVTCVELSALRYPELEPLVDNLDQIHEEWFTYVSFHAPSAFSVDQEERVVSLLKRVAERGWNVVIHPDVIYTPALWAQFGSLLLVENMDRRKCVGRTVEELNEIFCKLPKARLCLDVAHARQLDTTLTLLQNLINNFKDRIQEVHISELDSRCQHRPLTQGSVADYRRLAPYLKGIPVIIESVLDGQNLFLRNEELNLAREAMCDPVSSDK